MSDKALAEKIVKLLEQAGKAVKTGTIVFTAQMAQGGIRDAHVSVTEKLSS